MSETEKYSAGSEVRKVNLGIMGAIITVKLNREGRTNEMKAYELPAKRMLDYLANPESLIHKIRPHVFEEHEDVIEKARETFPQEESLDHLQRLLNMYKS